MILAERDETAAFTAAADGVLEKRRYYGQNWRSDTAMLATDTGKLVENVKYFSNGVAAEDPAGDIDGNRTWDSTDAAAITGGYDITKDVDMDGSVNSNDITQANAINGGYLTTALALGLPSQVNNRKAYAGYELEPNLLGSKFHVRNRVLDGELGRWSRRDPLGYVDGMGVYEYVQNAPTSSTDPEGTIHLSCDTDANDSGCLFICLRGNLNTNYCTPGAGGSCKPGRYGDTGCYLGRPKCCVCTLKIRDAFPNGYPVVAACQDAHELSHFTDPLICKKQQQDSNSYQYCSECDAYRAEVRCLRNHIADCANTPDPAKCTEEVLKKLFRAEESVSDYCGLCDETGGHPRTK